MERAIEKILKKENLSREEAFQVMDLLTQESCSEEVASRFLLGLKEKTETVDEIVGFVRCLRSKARKLKVKVDGEFDVSQVIDVCGTGGGKVSTFNVSTTVAFILAAAGVPVAKHGNRAVSSRSGSFDVLEALGIQSGERELEALEKFNLEFFFAPAFHPALKTIGPLRKKLGVHTVFNLLGPLLNPLGVLRQVIGVYDVGLVEKIAQVLLELGAVEAMIVHGHDGVDEFSISAPSKVAHLKNGKIQTFIVTPEDCDLKSATLDSVQGGDAVTNAQIVVQIFRGEAGPRRDLVLINAAAAFVVAGKVSDLKNGVKLAAEEIDSGRALALLEKMREGVS